MSMSMTGLVQIGTIYRLNVSMMLDDPERQCISARETLYVLNAPDAIKAFETIQTTVHDHYNADADKMIPAEVRMLNEAAMVNELPSSGEFIVYQDQGQRHAA